MPARTARGAAVLHEADDLPPRGCSDLRPQGVHGRSYGRRKYDHYEEFAILTKLSLPHMPPLCGGELEVAREGAPTPGALLQLKAEVEERGSETAVSVLLAPCGQCWKYRPSGAECQCFSIFIWRQVRLLPRQDIQQLLLRNWLNLRTRQVRHRPRRVMLTDRLRRQRLCSNDL